MGKQTGAVQIEGRVGGVIFYKTRKGKALVRQAPAPSVGIAYKTNPNTEQSRCNNTEFGRAATSTAWLRRGVEAVFDTRGDEVHFRLTAALLRCMKDDPVNPLGQRQLTATGMAPIAGFEWNEVHAAAPLLGAAAEVTGSILTVTAQRPLLPEGCYSATVRLAILGFDAARLLAKKPAAVVSVDSAVVVKGSGQSLVLSIALPATGLWIAVLGYPDMRAEEMPVMVVAAGG
jgi:hypothetical protein